MKQAFVLNIQKNKLLSELSTFGIGGPALFFVEVTHIEEMKKALQFAKEEDIPFFVVGKGSNCLFDDRGFNGLVILNKISYLENPLPGFFKAGSGYSFSLLGVKTARAGWSGLEFASGIPATVGGAVFMNAGANGKETANTIVSVEYLNQSNEMISFSKENLTFSYRTSPFQKMHGVILSASFQLTQAADARNKQLDIIHYRQITQPYKKMSAGCIFKNPVSSSAGAIIDQCGLKGLMVGGAKVSELHANFIVNEANATCKDVKALIEVIREKVQLSMGITLESEVRYVSYDPISS